MCRFEEVTKDVYDRVDRLVGEKFPYLSGCHIHIVFDTKKRKTSGEFVLGRLQSTNDLLKFFSKDNEVPEGADYILYIDKNVWKEIDETDKKRLLFHELSHASVDLDKKQPYGIRDHDIKAFSEELEENKDDPKWVLRLSTIADSIYSKDK
jgi:predicted AlkP superfamily phosphohydrolase/phosphomutase